MAITEEERKIDLAYNIGSLLSIYEPKLLESFIRSNEKSEFVKIMKIAKENNELFQGIPRKEFTHEFKNGYYNAQSLSRNDPGLLDRLIATKTLHKDYIRGLQSGKTAYTAKKLTEKIKSQPTPVAPKDKPGFKRGFNDAYLLSGNHADVLKFAIDVQARWSPYMRGLQAGQTQYQRDKEQGLLPDKAQSKSDADKKIPNEDYLKIRNKVADLKEHTTEKLEFLKDKGLLTDQEAELDKAATRDQTNFMDLITPGWSENIQEDKDDKTPNTDPDKDIEPDR